MQKMRWIYIVLTCFLIFSGVANIYAADKQVELAYVEWSCATASVNVMKAILQEKMGYDVEVIPRKGLKKDKPDVYKLLDNFNWTLAEIGQVQGWNADGADPYDSAKRWIKENPDRVNEWIK